MPENQSVSLQRNATAQEEVNFAPANPATVKRQALAQPLTLKKLARLKVLEVAFRSRSVRHSILEGQPLGNASTVVDHQTNQDIVKMLKKAYKFVRSFHYMEQVGNEMVHQVSLKNLSKRYHIDSVDPQLRKHTSTIEKFTELALHNPEYRLLRPSLLEFGISLYGHEPYGNCSMQIICNKNKDWQEYDSSCDEYTTLFLCHVTRGNPKDHPWIKETDLLKY